MAIVTATRMARHKGIPIESVIANFFADAEASYRDLVETAHDAIISFDQDGRIIGWNSAAQIMFGHSKGAAIGSVFSDLRIPKSHVSVLQRQFESIEGTRLRKSPSIRSVEIEGKRRDGSLFPIEISVSVRAIPNGRVTTCIIRDITERKRVEEALQAACAYNRSLIEASLDPLVTISAEGKIPMSIWQLSESRAVHEMNLLGLTLPITSVILTKPDPDTSRFSKMVR